jgi:hypothetical protein
MFAMANWRARRQVARRADGAAGFSRRLAKALARQAGPAAAAVLDA